MRRGIHVDVSRLRPNLRREKEKAKKTISLLGEVEGNGVRVGINKRKMIEERKNAEGEDEERMRRGESERLWGRTGSLLL